MSEKHVASPVNKKLAITIAGAVSLGSYEAGVLFEILRALGEHNTKNPKDRIEIDVLTGASAGGMTAVTAAQKLLFDADALKEPYDNVFFNTWIKEISLDRLLALQPPEDTKLSFFSSNAIQAIADDYITGKFAPKIPYRSHPAAAETIKLGLALSNLTGVDFSYPIARKKGQPGKDFFDYTRFQDQKLGDVSSSGTHPELAKEWEQWRDAAVACGAFPFAFRVRELVRDFAEYASSPRITKWASTPRPFPYSDGGLFQNEPLGIAKDFVDEIDQHADSDSRFYLFVAPGAKASTANSQFNAAGSTFVRTAEAIAAAVFNQARYHDWIQAEDVNHQIELFDLRAEQLYNGILGGAIDPGNLQPAADVLLPHLFQLRPPQANTETSDDARRRLESQFKNEFADLSKKSEAAAKAWIDSILVLETAAQLSTKDEMTIYDIIADPDELQGHQFFAFRGFFDLRFRFHDYNLGRTKAREFLQSHRSPTRRRRTQSANLLPEIGPIFCTLPADVYSFEDAVEKGLVQRPSVLADVDSKKQLLRAIMQRVDGILKDLGVPALLQMPLKCLIVRPKLKAFLDAQLKSSDTAAF